MAKKGGAQQLQADINSDEEFEKFIDRPGLLVLDVYSEWCGPCLGMIGSLRKIKLEIGGDNLHLAICKTDTISYLSRFRRKSEPIWLFVANQKAVNLMFGTNVPKLMKLITHELNAYLNKTIRTYYEITELQPEELRRKEIIDTAIAEAKTIEEADRLKKRKDYLLYVTDTIMENLPDIGITLFGPQVSRDMFKKVMEPADLLKIQCKDRKVMVVNKEHFDTINFFCRNPLPQDVLDQIDQRELLVCFWKVPEDLKQSVPEILNIYANELTKKIVQPPDEFSDMERVLPPIIAPMELKIKYEADEGEICDEEQEEEPIEDERGLQLVDMMEGFEDGEEHEEGEENEEESPRMSMPKISLTGLDDVFDNDEFGEGEIEPEQVETPQKKRICIQTITIPPIWVPSNHRTHAALIYVFFRQATAPFLPPDPVPEPPHVIMAFDAYKKRDLQDILEKQKNDIPVYGFFTSDDVDEAKLIANSIQSYEKQKPKPTDKLVFKVNKQTSNTMLALTSYGPTYVSMNTTVGREEAAKFFPEGYVQDEQAPTAEEEKGKKKKKAKAATPESSDATVEPTPSGATTVDTVAAELFTNTGEGVQNIPSAVDVETPIDDRVGPADMQSETQPGLKPETTPETEASLTIEAPPGNASEYEVTVPTSDGAPVETSAADTPAPTDQPEQPPELTPNEPAPADIAPTEVTQPAPELTSSLVEAEPAA